MNERFATNATATTMTKRIIRAFSQIDGIYYFWCVVPRGRSPRESVGFHRAPKEARGDLARANPNMIHHDRIPGVARLALILAAAGLTASASPARGQAPTKASPQAFLAAPQAPPVLYQPPPITPQLITPTPVPPPTPIAPSFPQASPQASAQAPTCACYFPQGYCPFPSGDCVFPGGYCPMPQGNCVAPAPQYLPPAPSGQFINAPAAPSAQFNMIGG